MSAIKYPRYDVPSHPQLAAALNELVTLIAATRAPKVVGGRGISVSSSAEAAVVSLGSSEEGARYTGRFRCYFDPDAQRLWITPGFVADLGEDEEYGPVLTFPYEPYIDGKKITELPYWEVSSLDNGVRYDVMVLVGHDMPYPKLALIRHDSQIDEADCRAAFCVANFTLGAAEGGKTMAEFKQRWVSDISIPAPTGPFIPVLHCDGSGGWYVTVTRGTVAVRDIAMGLDAEAMSYPDCPSRAPGGVLHKYPITTGKAVYVRVFENNVGAVGSPDEGATPAVDIVVDSDTKKSMNYYPISGTAAQQGVYYYMLAALTVTAGVPVLTRYLAGSNITHVCGLSADAVLVDCSGDGSPEDPGNQLQRLRFVSGRLAGLNEAPGAVPWSHIKSVIAVTFCSAEAPP